MKERPIIMSAESVLAILAGCKTQTRRVIVPQPVETGNGWFEWGHIHGAPKASSPKRAFWNARAWQERVGSAPLEAYCRYGAPGDRLWARETWNALFENPDTGLILPWQDTPKEYRTQENLAVEPVYRAGYGEDEDFGWVSPLFMPRWAARLRLEITAIRVERVQDIRTGDVLAEGVQRTEDGYWIGPLEGVDYPFSHAWEAYSRIWDRLNARRGFDWDANPWVWVLEFQIVG